MVIPQGVSGVLVDLRDTFLRRYAARKGIRLSTDADEPSSPVMAPPPGSLETVAVGDV